MKALAAVLISALMTGCASAPPMPPSADLFHDALFAPAAAAIEPEQALAMSGSMRAFYEARLRHVRFGIDRRRWLMDALYRRDELRLEYDASMTRTAAQAFESRSGNCLALVMMTGAFAKAMGLSVRYQFVLGEESFDRVGDLSISIGHVNLTLNDQAQRMGWLSTDRDPWVVDFLPSSNARAQRTRAIQEPTVIAMYLNNRAVESLIAGQANDAYWWAREAIRTDPELLGAYITLGVVYRNQRHPEFADQALQRVLAREPGNTTAMANRVLVLDDLGRGAEAAALKQQLARLDPHPPFSYFNEGMAALRQKRFEAARALFAKEVERAPYQHEFQFWLAVAYAELHDPKRAAAHLQRAMEVSTTRKDHDLYAAKLDRLKALRAQ